MTDPADLAERFEAQRPRLRAIASHLLGTAADAEDAVQETWLRLERAEAGQIRNLDAWLTTVVSRVSLDVLRAPRRSREIAWQSVELWTGDEHEPDPADLVADADRAAGALLVVLETLGPAERIALVLHDVFGQPFAEIAEVLQRSPEAVRQLASRARRQVRSAGSPAAAVSRSRQRAVVEAWLSAVSSGDLAALLALLDENAVLHADYGKSTQELRGRDEIAGQALLSARLAAHSSLVRIDGLPGVAASWGEKVMSLMAFRLEAERIVELVVLADPERLSLRPARSPDPAGPA